MTSMIKEKTIFLLLIASFICYSCTKDSVKETVDNFYFSFQNLDFEKAKTYCNPLMSYKLTLIQEEMTEEKRSFLEWQLKKSRMKIESISYDEKRGKAKVTIGITSYKEGEKIYETDIILLEKINNSWKIIDF